MILRDLIQIALKEDMPSGDLTTESLGLLPRLGRCKLIAKQDLVLSGSTAFEQSILALEPGAKLKWHFKDGDKVLHQQIICTLQGDLLQILKAERVALNFLMHFTGIASLTAQFVEKVQGTKTKILDTRKTTPLYRELEKKAVTHGGGLNHRLNLSEAVMIKDNHISVCGGIKSAVERVRSHTMKPLEVEARTLSDVQECIDLKVQRILLDNMNNELLQKSLALIPEHIQTEASGNMTLERVASVAALGPTFISVGALTHSAPAADISLMFDWKSS
jgi:nicotinate-nucleotide pyrophosphorylase (carboxylating)